MGSGSGIQLIAALKLFPSLRKMVGFEKDRRAINVSKFNAYLNGVGDRVAIVGNESELKAAIEADGNQVDFALSNPPFMPIPESIDIDPEDVQILSNAKAFRIVDKESAPKISLREMWPMSGWGGADGLTVFRPMLEILFPILKPSGRIIAYGQFAGNAIGPTKIEEFIESVGGWQYGWDPLKLDTPYHAASYVIRCIIGWYPELTLLLHTDFMMRYAEKIMDIYQSLGITGFHIGFLNLRKVG
jgi:hypothetical protein